jgi:hypothetical protein
MENRFEGDFFTGIFGRISLRWKELKKSISGANDSSLLDGSPDKGFLPK